MSQMQFQTPGHRPGCGCSTCRPTISATIKTIPNIVWGDLSRALLVHMRPAEYACQTCGEWLAFDGSCRTCAPSTAPCRLCSWFKRRGITDGVCWADHENGSEKDQHDTCEHFERRCVRVSAAPSIAPDLARGLDFEVLP